ncbi:MAG: efflux RND transporter permease subunit [Pseudomonadales bacterium]|nr:efflux RND transporter permease subunit [Pseudomonadales bacterium]
MKFLTRWFLDNPVAANLLMVFILVAGILTYSTLRVESFPQIPATQLIISVTYPGGTPRQVDEGITQRIEDAISGVPGIHSIRSESWRGLANITVKKNTGVDLDRLMEDVRNEVESIVGFPDAAEKPRIFRDEYGNLAAFVIIYGGQDKELLQTVSTRVETALKKHPAIAEVFNWGKRQKQLLIEPRSEALQRYGLDMEDLTNRIHQWSLEFRSGELKTARGTITLSGSQYADDLLALERLPVISNTQAIVRLGDIASIRRTYQEDESLVRYNDANAVTLMVNTSQKDHLMKVSEAIDEVIAEMKPMLPDDMNIAVMADMAPYISEQLDLLGTNAWQGLVIVLIVLGIFLEVRLAFWVALGIPISVAGALALMGLPALDYSINDITLFGMILVLGILVDDAVVVGEAIHSARQKTKDPKEAAWRGVESVTIATVFGVLTTIAAFSPMLWIENELAKVLAGFSAVVIFALIFSLIESKFILPTHLALEYRDYAAKNLFIKILLNIRHFCNAALERFSERTYQPILQKTFNHRWAALMVFSSAMLFSYGALNNGLISSAFFPEIPGRFATVEVDMDQDAARSLTMRNADQLETAIIATNQKLAEEFQLLDAPIERYIVAMTGSLRIELTAELSEEALAEIPSVRLLEVWRETSGQLEGSYAVSYRLAEQVAGGTAITVATNDRALARQVASDVRHELAQLPGVNDVYDDGQSGKRQLNIRLNERGIQLGIDQRQLATLVGGAFGNFEIHRLLDDAQEMLVQVKLPEQDTHTLEQFRNTTIRTGQGGYVTLGEISHFTQSREPEVLYRRNRNEVVTVYWNQDRSISSPEAVWQRLSDQAIPELNARYPGVIIEAVGEFEEIGEVQTGFRKAMILTLLLIYVLLAVPLKSYWQPFIIMSVIPFGFAGAILGHGLMGLSFSLLSMFGLMAMTGVVINDSLVLMTRFNQLMDEGYSKTAALIKAGKSRLRAIFLTTVTTVCGLLPLLSETSEQAQYLKPAAVSLVFGELFATPITLVLIPLLLSLGKYRQKGEDPATTGNPLTGVASPVQLTSS